MSNLQESTRSGDIAADPLAKLQHEYACLRRLAVGAVTAFDSWQEADGYDNPELLYLCDAVARLGAHLGIDLQWAETDTMRDYLARHSEPGPDQPAIVPDVTIPSPSGLPTWECSDCGIVRQLAFRCGVECGELPHCPECDCPMDRVDAGV